MLVHVLNDECLGLVLQCAGPMAVSLLQCVSSDCRMIPSTTAGRCFWRFSCREQHKHMAHQKPLTESPDSGGGVSWFVVWRTDYAPYFMRAHRQKLLETALEMHGLELRADSWQCANYIRGGGGVIRLLDVVEFMVEMDFLYTKTAYAEVRQDILDEIRTEAFQMSVDAHDSGEVSLADPALYYVLRPAEQITALAKQRAFILMAQEMTLQALTVLAPKSLRAKIPQYISNPISPSYDNTPLVSRAGYRSRARQQVDAQRAADDVVTAPHAARLDKFVQDGACGLLLFDKGLTRSVRAAIHDLAEDYGLEHESRGVEPNRQLHVWSEHLPM